MRYLPAAARTAAEGIIVKGCCAKKCEKKLGTVITPDTWKDGARNTTESGGRKLNENKALTSKKARFDPYEIVSSPLAEFVKVLYTNWVLIIARAVPTKRASALCVEKRFWIPKTTSKCLFRCIEVSDFLYDLTFCFEFSRHNLDVQVTK